MSNSPERTKANGWHQLYMAIFEEFDSISHRTVEWNKLSTRLILLPGSSKNDRDHVFLMWADHNKNDERNGMAMQFRGGYTLRALERGVRVRGRLTRIHFKICLAEFDPGEKAMECFIALRRSLTTFVDSREHSTKDSETVLDTLYWIVDWMKSLGEGHGGDILDVVRSARVTRDRVALAVLGIDEQTGWGVLFLRSNSRGRGGKVGAWFCLVFVLMVVLLLHEMFGVQRAKGSEMLYKFSCIFSSIALH